MSSAVAGSQYADHASISLRRFSSASLRRYACSALSPMTWASAVSVTSRGKLETLPAQSRKLERKPCTGAFSTFNGGSYETSYHRSSRRSAEHFEHFGFRG